MVDIREENSERDETSNGNGANGRPGQPTVTLLDFVKQRSADSMICVLRLVTICFGFLYLFPFGGRESQDSAYSKTLMAAAATNALRMHHRLGGLQLNRQFFASMFLEDSCHYLFYSVLFLGCSPITMALMPVLLFAILHASSFILKMLNAIGQSHIFLHRWLSSLTENYTQNLLGVISCTEIFLMPLVIGMIFMGKASIFVPFIYYRFLTLRYMSRRNPNTRTAFRQMRQSLEQSVASPSCPMFLRNICLKFISLVERLCPAPVPT